MGGRADSDDVDDDDLIMSDLNQQVITSIEPAPITVGGEINDQSAFHEADSNDRARRRPK